MQQKSDHTSERKFNSNKHFQSPSLFMPLVQKPFALPYQRLRICTFLTSTTFQQPNFSQPMKITTKLKTNRWRSWKYATQNSQPHIGLNSINLKGLHNVQEKVMLQPTIHPTSPSGTIYHTTILFYGVLSSALVLAVSILVQRCRLIGHTERPEIRTEEPETSCVIPEKPETAKRTPVTFALNILKYVVAVLTAEVLHIPALGNKLRSH